MRISYLVWLAIIITCLFILIAEYHPYKPEPPKGDTHWVQRALADDSLVQKDQPSRYLQSSQSME